MKCKVLDEVDSLEKFLQQNGELNSTVVQGLNLREVEIDWREVSCDGAVFLGCEFPDEVAVSDLWEKGAMIFPAFKNLPYNPYRPALYTREELMEGWAPEKDESVDLKIYEHFVAKGKVQPEVMEALAERMHDHAIDDALQSLLNGEIEEGGAKKVVAIMGGHGTARNDPFFVKVAHLARRLTREGFFVATGGGPGMMEAGNMGAYLADLSVCELDEVLDSLAGEPTYRSKGYVASAQRVVDRYPDGCSSLAVPTWFYGHEPTNLFSRHVAKYFSNSIREDGLLAIASHGVVFSPGSAGTTQEVFMDATQNHYATFENVSPMVFLGKKRFSEDTMIYPCLSQLAEGRVFQDMLTLSDDVEEIIEYIKNHPPVPSVDGVKANVSSTKL